LDNVLSVVLIACPGKIRHEESEKKNGGRGQRRSCAVRAKKMMQEAGVGVKTGKILERKAGGLNPD
jgi:hypothetical protein